MDNRFTQTLEKEGTRAIAKYLQALLHSVQELKDQMIDLKKQISTKPDKKGDSTNT